MTIQPAKPLDVLMAKEVGNAWQATASADTGFEWTDELHAFVHTKVWVPFQRLTLGKQLAFVREFVDSAAFELHVPLGFRELLGAEHAAQTHAMMRTSLHARLDEVAAASAAAELAGSFSDTDLTDSTARALLDELLNLDPKTGKRYYLAPEAGLWPLPPIACPAQRTHAHCPRLSLMAHCFGIIVEHVYDSYVSLESAYAAVYEMVRDFEARGLPREAALEALGRA